MTRRSTLPGVVVGAFIDTETEALIQNALEVVKQGRTTFVIAHRLSMIKSADLILVLDRGNHDKLMEKQGKYCQMVRILFRFIAAA